MAATTPGPWEAKVLGSEGYTVMGPPREGRITRTFVARCGMNDWDTDKANAHLIAALPELLTLVSELTDAGDCWYDHHGYCQGHNLQDRPCPHERAKAIIEQLGGEG